MALLVNEAYAASTFAETNSGLNVAAGPSDGTTPPISGAHPMEIATDGAGTVFGGQARQDRLVVEIMDPGRRTIGSTSLAEMGVDENAKIQEECHSPYHCRGFLHTPPPPPSPAPSPCPPPVLLCQVPRATSMKNAMKMLPLLFSPQPPGIRGSFPIA